MKLIIAGSRNIHLNPDELRYLMSKHNLDPRTIKTVVSGVCCGMDESGENFALKFVNSLNRIKRFPADWNKYGRLAGPLRNQKMAQYADALFLVWDGTSRGSANMRREMEKLEKPIYEVIFRSAN